MTTFTVKDLCNRYGVAEHTVLSWIRSGQLRALNVGRHPSSKKPRWRVTSEALEAFELCRTHSPPPSRTRRRRKQESNLVEFY